MKVFGVLYLLLVLFVVPIAAHAQSGLPIFDPNWHVVPDAHQLDADCPVGAPLGFAGALQLAQNVINATISLGIIICVLIIMFAGILWLLTPTNPENHSQARNILTNAVIGLLIILSAWLMVDFVMKLLYDGDNTRFGPWNSILTGGDFCITAASSTPLFKGDVFARPGLGGSYSVPVGSGVGACNPALLKTKAQEAGLTLSDADAQTFACIARPESACGAANPLNYNWGKGSTAVGPFQVLLSTHSDCYETAVCRKAAGVTEPLNCDAGFSGGNPRADQKERVQRCINAASNLSCSLSAAICVKKKQGFSAWTKDNNSAQQNACIRGK